MNRIKLLTILCTTVQVMSSYSIASNYYYNNHNVTQANLNNAIDNLLNSNNENNQSQNNNYNISDGNNGNESNNNMQNTMNINTDYNPINIDEDDNIPYNIFLSNNNNTTFNINNNNGNNKIFIGKKTKKDNTQNNVTFTYNEFNRANNKLKSIINNDLKTLNEEYSYYHINGYKRIAEKLYKKILLLIRLDSKSFPILDPLLHCDDHFKINRIVQQIKELKNNIQHKINYEDNNCEEKSNEYKKLKRILDEMNTGNIYRTMYRELKKMGLITYNKNRKKIKLYSSAKQLDIVRKQSNLETLFSNIYNKLLMLNNTNEIKNTIELFYSKISDENTINTIFTRYSDITDIVTRDLLTVFNKLLAKIMRNKLNKEFMPYGMARSITSFNAMKERLINGDDFTFDYTKRLTENSMIFSNYYQDMLLKSDVFHKSFEKEKHNTLAIIDTLEQYDNIISENLTLFLNKNKESITEKYLEISRERLPILNKARENQIKDINFIELLTTLENNINSGNTESISTFAEQIDFFIINRLSNINSYDDFKKVKDILVNNEVKDIITNRFIKTSFKSAHNLQEVYDIIINISLAFYNLYKGIHVSYPEWLRDILLDYSNSIQKNADDELKKYNYVLDTNKAIVPAGFWNKK